MTKKSLLLATALVPLGAAITFAELTPSAPSAEPTAEGILQILEVPSTPQLDPVKLAHNTEEEDDDDDGSQESDDDDDGSRESDDDDDGSQEADDDDDGSQEADDDDDGSQEADDD